MHTGSVSQDSRTVPWTPKSWADLKCFPALISQSGGKNVVSTSPGVVTKFGDDHADEIRAMRFARNILSLPVPKVLQHPPLYRRPHPSKGRPSGVWYFSMERCPGISLERVIDTMTTDELDHVADQLKSILAQMASARSKTLGSVTGGPYNNFFFPNYTRPKYAFTSVGEFIDHYRRMLLLFCTEEFTESVFVQLPRNAAIRFAHGDLLPRNIIVDGSDITGVVDWATAGFYPEYWEYCQMHNPSWVTPGWDHVLRRIFPGPRRQMEIKGVRQLLDIINSTF
jgi:hypothetical protein